VPDMSERDYRTGSVESADGTEIGYRELGSGPSIIVVHGGMQAAQNFMGLGRALAPDYTVYLPDRRGRGTSGPHGAEFGIAREVEDMQALVAATGATRIFGLSSGALVSLRTALATPALTKVALYEPPLSVDGSAPVDWGPRVDRELAAGKTIPALITALKGMGTEPMFARIPRFVLTPAFSLAMRAQRTVPEGDIPIPDLVPTIRFDRQLLLELADTAPDYAAITARVLLLGGSKSPAYLHTALDALSSVLPNATRTTFPGLDHSGPDDNGNPPRVAEALREFYAR
jgi:pimeloyl-ACP methyl ester carboxylesterase